MPRFFRVLIVWQWLFAGLASASASEPVDYVRDIKPLLARRCFSCHDNLKQKNSLRLDVAALILKGGDSGPAIVPGNSAQSLLIERVTAPEGERMPPEGDALTSEEIALLTRWIDEGASAPEEPVPLDPRLHWAFQPPKRPSVPVTPRSPPGAGNAIDAFIAERHAETGLVPLPKAAPHILLRRLFLDLVGVPPTRAELHAFVADPSPEAYERVVDRLLASPKYGERWGRHWMDVWRYSDWAGFGAEVRYSQRHIWRWRDWIIKSLNADKGYDRMVQEMLAADELAPTDMEALPATGFLARNWYLFNRNYWLDSTVEHTGKALLGITFNCARCHDHRYDPIAQQDYYHLRAVFEPHNVRTDRVPGQPDISADGLARVYDKDAAAATYLFERGNEAKPDTSTALVAAVPAVLGGNLEIEPVPLPAEAYYPALTDFVQKEALTAARTAVEQAQAALDLAQTKLAEAPLDPNLPAAALDAAGSQDPAATLAAARSAAALAEKVLATARANQAATNARVAADQARYGRQQGTDAQALAQAAGQANREYLAAKAEEDVLRAEQALESARQAAPAEADKAPLAELEKKLADARAALEAASAVRAQPTGDYPPLGEVYPATSTGRRLALARWIANRANPLAARVAVNHIWLRHFDSALVPTVFDFGRNGKPPTHPKLLDWLAVELMDSGWSIKHLHRLIVRSEAYQASSAVPAGHPNLVIDSDNHFLWRANTRRLEAESVRDSLLYVAGNLDGLMGGPDLDHNLGLTAWRRSVYFRHAYEKKMLFLSLFDGPSENECYQRTTSIIPQQALALANSPLALSQSRMLAERLSLDSGASDPAFVTALFEQVLSRAPSPAELAECVSFLERQSQLLADPAQLTGVTAGPAPERKPATDSRQRARENLVHVLFNHHDFVTVR